MQDSIIVYRNPAEKMIWESLMGSDVGYYITLGLLGLTVLFISFHLLDKFMPTGPRSWASFRYRDYWNIVLAFLISASSCYGLHIWTIG